MLVTAGAPCHDVLMQLSMMEVACEGTAAGPDVGVAQGVHADFGQTCEALEVLSSRFFSKANSNG
jgi:hypothetical protein